MPYELDNKLVVAISSRALFDLDQSHQIYEQEGLEAYRAHQAEHEDEALLAGTGYPLAKGLLALNKAGKGEMVEVVLISRNDADTGLRVMNSVEHRDLPIERAVFTGGRAPFEYLRPFSCDLFLSANEDDVRQALKSGFAAGLVYQPPVPNENDGEEVRIAFDGDAVLFSPEAEQIYQREGLTAFHQREKDSAEIPLEPGPFKPFLEKLHAIQRNFSERECPIRTALVTARSAPAHKRAIKTLRAWNVRLDECFFLGGVRKKGILEVFKPHIFFDDQSLHCDPVAVRLPTARVPSDEQEPKRSPARKRRPKRRAAKP
ncbi:5'-nucleotidase [Planctomycetes bacterium Pan216]|uniref:5'-nucleotidase n=1 Tax=Kolteria novifilia TaxID=2527975 RepID=A0A518BB24_9BACT|nr:5'-nucleotidase [Planctomycetes bacterium Pan216]